MQTRQWSNWPAVVTLALAIVAFMTYDPAFGQVRPGAEGQSCGGIVGRVCQEGLECVFPPRTTRGTCERIRDDLERELLESAVLWQAAGSTGAVDESSLSRFNFRDEEASFRPGRQGGVILRYNVDCDCGWACAAAQNRIEIFQARYRDNGTAANVHVALERTHFETGDRETIFVFDSDEEPSSSQTRTVSRRVPEQYQELECAEYTYYFEVRLQRSGGGDARLSILRLRN